MIYFNYTNKETDYLKKRDSILGAEIDRIGMIKREVDPDIFTSLISSIISQQISTKAAITVKERLTQLIGPITPENIEKVKLESIQQCGLSFRKAGYIKGIAKSAVTKIINFGNLHKLSDEEVIEELVKLKGVGEWTAQMMLIHSLQRPNILSFKDLGIRRGIMKLYNLEDLAEIEFQKYRETYSPYCTVASLYLWEISSGNSGK